MKGIRNFIVKKNGLVFYLKLFGTKYSARSTRCETLEPEIWCYLYIHLANVGVEPNIGGSSFFKGCYTYQLKS